MHTVELLEEAVNLAQRLGYKVRQEWMGGAGGGGCEIKGRKWIFLDLALGPFEQLDIVLDTLRGDPSALSLPMAHPLRELLRLKKTA
jgi:hypothetical protein